ncbi:MAG: PDZ domain-containing protein, partial [Bacteroidota bacterium]
MSFWDKNPNLFRILLITITAFLFTLNLINFIHTTSRLTDENLWVDLPSKNYITKEIPAQKIDKNDSKFSNDFPDTIKTGSLLIGFNAFPIRTEAELKHALDSLGKKPYCDIIVLNPGEMNKGVKYRVSSDLIKKSEFVQLNSAVLIVSVTKGGASDKAGIRVGDIITKVNGEYFMNAFDADRLLQENNDKSYIEYEILR